MSKGHVNTVLLLLSCGADANVTDRHGDTALWKLVDQDLSEAALYMVQDHHASIARCSRDRKKVTKARLMLKHVEKKQRQGHETGSQKPWLAEKAIFHNCSRHSTVGSAGKGGRSSYNYTPSP